MVAEIRTIAETALRRTREGKLSWSSTVDENTFLTVIGDQSITVTHVLGVGYVLKVLNGRGVEVARLDTSRKLTDPPGFITGKHLSEETLEELFRQARSQALGAEEELEKLLHALNAR